MAEPPVATTVVREALRSWAHLGLDGDDVTVEAIPRGATGDVYLVRRDAERWVAKCTYAFRDYFVSGLEVSKVVARELPYDTAVPVATSEGADTVLVEMDQDRVYPMALLTYVDGRPLGPDDTDVPEVVGQVCARVHKCLLDVQPSDVHIAPVAEAVPPVDDTWDLGEHGWLNDLYGELGRHASTMTPHVRHTVGVWDGPDIRITDDRRVGLIDFGHTGCYPLPHTIASRSLGRAVGDRRLYDRFIAAFEAHLPLTESERAALDVYRLVNATIYARWAVSHPSPETTGWAEELIAYICRDLERVGLSRADFL